MEEGDGPSGSHGILRWTIRTVGVAAFFGLLAAHHFAQSDQTQPASVRIAQSGPGRGLADPDTTGSIAQGARAVKLDPCNLHGGLRTLRP